MPVHFDRYQPDHSMGNGIGGFLLSGQLRDAVKQGAQDVVAHAIPGSSTLASSWEVNAGPDVIVTRNGNPRLSERVESHHPAAASIEFGSGQGAEGSSGKKDRPQGGWNAPKRILGTAGSKVADRFGEVDD